MVAGFPMMAFYSRCVYGETLDPEEMERWFGPYATKLQVNATGNLPYNMALLAGARIGAYLTLKLHCTYEGLRFIPLSPALESGTVLAWKKTETVPPAVTAPLEHIKKMPTNYFL